MSDTPMHGASGMRARDDTFGEVASGPTQKYCPRCNTRHPSHYKLCPNDGTLLVAADDLVGTTLADSYVVTRILGEGGMGRVYEARHTRLESKRFAIKTLHEDLAHHAQTVARFKREADIAAAIDSPHVVAVYDVDETPDGRLYLVSELLEGAELGAYLAEHKKLSVPLAVRIVRQICKALAAAHRAGAVHRDLKPENVFLTGDPGAPVAKVLDFGIAKFDDQTGKALTKTGMVMGTPAYMSPEQANGQKVDLRTDIYGAGAILYACLTGRAPFEGEDPGGVLVQVMTREPPPPRSVDPAIPAALELVIQHAMAPDRADRYQEAHELDAALAPFDVSDEALAHAGMSFDLAPYSQRGAPTVVRRGEDAERRAQRAERARRELDLLWTAGLGWLGLGLIAGIAGVQRLSQGGALAIAQAVAIVLGCAIALGVPGYLWVRRTRDRLDADEAIALADMLRGPIVAAVAVYGLATLLSRFAELVILRSAGAAWSGWDVLLWLASAFAGALVALPPVFERRGTRTFEYIVMPLERPALSAVVVVGLLVTMFGLLPLLRGAAGGGDAPSAVRIMQEVRALEEALAKGDLDGAAGHLAELADTDGAVATPDVQKAAMELASKSALEGGDAADRVFELLAEDMDAAGVDVLYRLHTEKGGSKAAERATTLLAEEEVRARGSPALRIAYDLRHAADCEAVVGLLERAEGEGDERALAELGTVLSCEREDRCCLEGDARVKGAVATLKQRLE